MCTSSVVLSRFITHVQMTIIKMRCFCHWNFVWQLKCISLTFGFNLDKIDEHKVKSMGNRNWFCLCFVETKLRFTISCCVCQPEHLNKFEIVHVNMDETAACE